MHAAVMLALLPVLGGCPAGPAVSKDAAKLPADWPIPELKLPAGALKQVLPETGSVDIGDGRTALATHFPAGEGSYTETKTGPASSWRVGFATDSSWSELAGSLDAVLLPLGFEKLRESPPALGTGAAGHTFTSGAVSYLSAERKMVVSLQYLEAQLVPGPGRDEGYSLSIMELPTTMPADVIDKLKRGGGL